MPSPPPGKSGQMKRHTACQRTCLRRKYAREPLETNCTMPCTGIATTGSSFSNMTASSSMPPAMPMTPDTTEVSTAVAPSSSQYVDAGGNTPLFKGYGVK
jgi:hypothetical protein